MNKLLQRVHDISGLDQNLHDNEMKLNMMDKRLEYLKSALDSPSTDHALFSLPERYVVRRSMAMHLRFVT